MDTEFKGVYNRIIFSAKDELEELRKKSLKKIISISAIVVLVILAVIVFVVVPNFEKILFSILESENLNNIIYAIVAVPLVLIIAIAAIVSNVKNAKSGSYARVYQDKVTKPLIKSVFENAEYMPFGGVSEVEYNGKKNEVYLERYNRFLGLQGVNAKDNKSLVFSEVKVEDTYMDRETGKLCKATVFEGIAGCFESPMFLREPVRILQNEITIKRVGFSKIGATYRGGRATEHIEIAKQILSEDIVNKLEDVKNNFAGNFEFVLYEDKIYFRIYNAEIFAPKMSKDALSEKNIKEYYDLLASIKDATQSIVDVLKNVNV